MQKKLNMLNMNGFYFYPDVQIRKIFKKRVNSYVAGTSKKFSFNYDNDSSISINQTTKRFSPFQMYKNKKKANTLLRTKILSDNTIKKTTLRPSTERQNKIQSLKFEEEDIDNIWKAKKTLPYNSLTFTRKIIRESNNDRYNFKKQINNQQAINRSLVDTFQIKSAYSKKRSQLSTHPQSSQFKSTKKTATLVKNNNKIKSLNPNICNLINNLNDNIEVQNISHFTPIHILPCKNNKKKESQWISKNKQIINKSDNKITNQMRPWSPNRNHIDESQQLFYKQYHTMKK